MNDIQRQERIRESKRTYYQKNRDRIRSEQAAYYERNQEIIRAKNRTSYLKNREARLIYERSRGAVRRDRFRQYVRDLADTQNGMCPCGELLEDDLNLDHDRSCCNKSVRYSCRACDRGVTHRNCNSILGFAGDDPAKLRNLADYLETKIITR